MNFTLLVHSSRPLVPLVAKMSGSRLLEAGDHELSPPAMLVGRGFHDLIESRRAVSQGYRKGEDLRKLHRDDRVRGNRTRYLPSIPFAHYMAPEELIPVHSSIGQSVHYPAS